jgi:Fe-Mn family superoxide dismutase
MHDQERRDFLRTAGLVAAGAMLASGAAAQDPMAAIALEPDALQDDSPGTAFETLYPGAWNAREGWALPKLRYSYGALEAAIDAQTMEIHHTKHHQAYVNGLRNAEAKLAEARSSGDFAMVEHWSRKASFHGGGHLLHCIFWDSMSPEGNTAPQDALADAITRDFGSFDAMMKQFAAAATDVEGSGWARLVYLMPARRLAILQGGNQNLLTTFGEFTLMALDVWEHAYYLRYQNNRKAYVEAFPQVLDWARIGRRFDTCERIAQQKGG